MFDVTSEEREETENIIYMKVSALAPPVKEAQTKMTHRLRY